MTPLWLKLAPVVFLLLWSGGYAVAKIGLQHVEPFTFLSLRYAGALVLLLPVAVMMRPPMPRREIDVVHVLVVGFLIQACYFGLSYLAFSKGLSAGAIALIVSLQPILVAILAPMFVAERVGIWGWIGLVLGLTGAAVVIVARSAVEAEAVSGILLAVCALISISVATLYEKRFGLKQHPVTVNMMQYAMGLAAILPLALQTETMHVDWTWSMILALAYLIIGNSIIAITLLLAMIRHGEASRVSSMLFLVPPLAALIAWGLIGEAMPPIAWIGMAVAAAGVALATGIIPGTKPQ